MWIVRRQIGRSLDGGKGRGAVFLGTFTETADHPLRQNRCETGMGAGIGRVDLDRLARQLQRLVYGVAIDRQVQCERAFCTSPQASRFSVGRVRARRHSARKYSPPKATTIASAISS